MEPHDDPEARIRELERPLADVARTSELGTQPFGTDGAQPPQPWPTYGAPYAAAPQRTSSGLRPGFLIGLIAVAFVVIAGGVVIFAANMSTRSESVTEGSPTFYGGDGSFDPAPSGQPSPPSSESETTPPPGAQISVSGIDENRTIACNDGVVSVSGVRNTVRITGHCVTLTVSGVENLVTVDTADTISASGFDNRVTFRSGSPQINVGGSNTVEQG